MSVLSDSLLLRRFKEEGDITSFEALFERHYDMVYGVLYRLTGTRQEAEDLAQEVFLKLYQRPLRKADNVAGWLYRVALNTGYNALRSSQRRLKREATGGRDLISPPSSPEQITLREETQAEVRAVLATLPERAVKLLILREMGFSYVELARVIGVAEGSVGTLLARAQKRFRKAYETQTGKILVEEDN